MQIRFSSQFFTALIAGFIIYTSSVGINAEEKLFYSLDNRPWNLGYQEKNDDESIIEFTLPREDVLNWSELFTVQTFDDVAASPEDFIKGLETATNTNSVPGQNTKFVRVEPASLNIVEVLFKAQDDPANNEYNLGRVIKNDDTLYYLRYSTKDQKVFEKNKQAWIDRLKTAYVADEPDQNKNKEGQWFNYGSEGVFDGSKKLIYQPQPVVYKDQKEGFSLPLPNNWLVKKTDLSEEVNPQNTDSIVLLFLSPDKSAYGGVAISEQTDNSHDSETDFRESFLKAYEEQEEGITVRKKGEIQTDSGEKGTYAIVEDGEKTGWIAFFDKNQKNYRLELWSPKNKFNDQKKDFEQIIKQFTLLSQE